MPTNPNLPPGTPTHHEAAVAAMHENFRFLCIEVSQQVRDAQTLMATKDASAAKIKKIGERDDYIDNLKSIIENKCFRLLASDKIDKLTTNLVRGINVSTNNLERLADFAVNVVRQLEYMQDFDTLHQFDSGPLFQQVLDGIDLVEDALFSRNMSKALEICRTEFRIDGLYDGVFREIMDELRGGEPPEDLVTCLFVFRYLERMGDALLNVGEAIIFAAVGEKLKVSEYQALGESLRSSEVDLDISDIDYEGIWETKSGSRIGTVHGHTGGPDARWVVFKEGRAKKLEEEREGLERWEELRPGLVPHIYGFHGHGDMASLLLEYCEGDTLQHLVLYGAPAETKAGYLSMVETIGGIWTDTMAHDPIAADFVKQLRKRLPDVYKVHPEFAFPGAQVGGYEARAFDELLDACAPLDEELVAPFRVQIHGDFNTDNVIVKPARDGIWFIDLHRTRPFDYAQDVSVFMVSNFRMPLFEPALRARLTAVSREFFHFACEFADKHGDETCHARVALGVARSLLTSTRFELDEDFSKAMMMRAVYLLEQLLDHRGRPWNEYRLNEDVLEY